MDDVLRVVIDTNHVISAILSGRGASAKLIDWLTRDEDYFYLLLSEPIWQEYSAVAGWLIPSSRQQEKDRIMGALRQHAVWIEPAGSLEVFLVTKNIRHFPHKSYGDVRIVRIRDFLNELERRAGSCGESVGAVNGHRSDRSGRRSPEE